MRSRSKFVLLLEVGACCYDRARIFLDLGSVLQRRGRYGLIHMKKASRVEIRIIVAYKWILEEDGAIDDVDLARCFILLGGSVRDCR